MGLVAAFFVESNDHRIYDRRRAELYLEVPVLGSLPQEHEAMVVPLQKYEQDLTADVNFSDLVRWGEELGFQTLSLETQRDFLLRWQPKQVAACSSGSLIGSLLACTVWQVEQLTILR